MSSFNKIILIGRLTGDPELRYTNEGIPLARYNLAVNRPFKNSSGDYETDFFNIICWRKLAEISKNYLTKGKLVLVEGSLRTRLYTGTDGVKRKVYEIHADNMQILSPKAQAVVEEEEMPLPPPPPYLLKNKQEEVEDKDKELITSEDLEGDEFEDVPF